jgi:hypothetical protein
MLSTFNFQINDSKETISELEGLIFKLERYGLISEFVLNTIFNVFHVIYKKEIKAYVKRHSPENEELLFNQDFYCTDIVEQVKDVEKISILFRDTIAYVLNSDRFIVDQSDLEAAASEIKKSYGK